MAWATKCDRCGGYFEHHQDETNGFTFLTYDRAKDKYLMDGEEYDLCPECVQSLNSWFRKKGDTKCQECCFPTERNPVSAWR